MAAASSHQKPDFSEVVAKHTDFVYNIALRMTGDPHAAEDVVQDTFLSAFKAWDSFRGTAQVSTWLYRIAVNAALMRARKEKKVQYLSDSPAEEKEVPSWAADPEREAINTELREKLQEGLKRLPPNLRAAVVLRDVQGFDSEEAARILGIPVPTLKTRLHRARVILRGCLAQYVGKPLGTKSP
jgi:RNA polymerase sigma-70 factor (ECF subfamily)